MARRKKRKTPKPGFKIVGIDPPRFMSLTERMGLRRPFWLDKPPGELAAAKKQRKPKRKQIEQKSESRLDRFTEKDFANITSRTPRTVSAWLRKSGAQDRWDKKKETIPYRMALAAVLIYNFLLGDERDTAIAKLKRLADHKGYLPRVKDLLKDGTEPGADIFPRKPDPSLLTEFHIKA
jgi:hypothetical protein